MLTTGTMLMAFSLLLVVGLFLARPFLLPRPQPPRLTERQAWLAERDALLAQIRALDFDAETGKQLPEEYTAERELLMQRATAVLARLEETADLSSAIEAAVAQLRAVSVPPVPAGVNFCTQCGTAVQPTDKFCAHCGTPLQGGQADA
jgi:hypothetical protein